MFYQNNLAMRNTLDVTGGKPIAACHTLFLFVFPTLIPLSGVVDKDAAVVFTTGACLTSILLETGRGTND
jgi:hypothetical protein